MVMNNESILTDERIKELAVETCVDAKRMGNVVDFAREIEREVLARRSTGCEAAKSSGFEVAWKAADESKQIDQKGIARYWYDIGRAQQASGSDENAWHDAVLNECMRIESCYKADDPAGTLEALINWHMVDASAVAETTKKLADNYLRLTCGSDETQSVKVDERALFEAHMRGKTRENSVHGEKWEEYADYLLKRAPNGDYTIPWVDAGWEYWQARAALAQQAAPGAPATQQAGAAVDAWRVGEFWSSANPGTKVLMLARGIDIENFGWHKDFIRWVGASPAATTASASYEMPEGVKNQIETLEWKLRNHERALEMRKLHDKGDVWYWQGDGNDNIESMSMGMVVVIRADQLRAALTRAPAPSRDAASDAPAAEEVRMLSEMIHDGGLDCLTPYVSWAIEDGAATLDGQFSADELIAIGRYMQTEGGAAMSASQGKTEEAK